MRAVPSPRYGHAGVNTVQLAAPSEILSRSYVLYRRWRMTSPARCFVLFLVSGALLVGCLRHSNSTPNDVNDVRESLSAVATHLSSTSSDDTNPLHLSVEAVPVANPVTLRCILVNVSSKPLRIKEESLPCAGWWSLQVRGLTTEGRFLPMRPPVGSRISAELPSEITMAPGETVVRELSLDSVYPLGDNPRNADVLLLWSYRRDRYHSTGVALLPHSSR
jgi:hypothetical protein